MPRNENNATCKAIGISQNADTHMHPPTLDPPWVYHFSENPIHWSFASERKTYQTFVSFRVRYPELWLLIAGREAWRYLCAIADNYKAETMPYKFPERNLISVPAAGGWDRTGPRSQAGGKTDESWDQFKILTPSNVITSFEQVIFLLAVLQKDIVRLGFYMQDIIANFTFKFCDFCPFVVAQRNRDPKRTLFI